MSVNAFVDALRSLRKEKAHLNKELSVPGEPSYHEGGYIDAKYARALRIQQIDREIDLRKREAFSLIYGGP